MKLSIYLESVQCSLAQMPRFHLMFDREELIKLDCKFKTEIFVARVTRAIKRSLISIGMKHSNIFEANIIFNLCSKF